MIITGPMIGWGVPKRRQAWIKIQTDSTTKRATLKQKPAFRVTSAG